MKHARTRALSRELGAPHKHIWAYLHSRLTQEDVIGVARAFGVPPHRLAETAARTSNVLTQDSKVWKTG